MWLGLGLESFRMRNLHILPTPRAWFVSASSSELCPIVWSAEISIKSLRIQVLTPQMWQVDCFVVGLGLLLHLVFDGYEFTCTIPIVIATFPRFAGDDRTIELVTRWTRRRIFGDEFTFMFLRAVIVLIALDQFVVTSVWIWLLVVCRCQLRLVHERQFYWKAIQVSNMLRLWLMLGMLRERHCFITTLTRPSHAVYSNPCRFRYAVPIFVVIVCINVPIL